MMTNGPGALVLGAEDRVAAVAAIKARLRVANVDEEPLIAAFAETALGLAERFTGQVGIVRSLSETLVASGAWQRLGAGPVRTIGTVTAGGGVLAAGGYAVDIAGDGCGWVRVAGATVAGTTIEVAYQAGLAERWDTLPPGLREGAAMLAAHLFDDRTGTQPVPTAVTALWRPFRMLRLGLGARP